MAGYGNHTMKDPEFDGHDTRFDKHTNSDPYQGGHETFKSGTLGGAGFGNKSSPGDDLDSYDNSDLRFDSHKDTAPYSGGHPERGSGTTMGAGLGNKTGSFGEDSRAGKMMEKIGEMTHNEGMVEKGRAKREAKGFKAEEEAVEADAERT